MDRTIEIEEIPDASEALIGWFKSQELSPGSAGIVMIHLLARLMVEKSRDPKFLQEGVNVHMTALVVEIAGLLRE